MRLAIPDPVYPGLRRHERHGGAHRRRTSTAATRGSSTSSRPPANGYVPAVPTAPADLVYLCFPNNPTGAVATRAQLAAWVDYARRNQAVILFDSAYEAYIRDPAIPHSIYEIEGAREVAIEFRSFSKTAGFTGTRCAYTVVPKTLMAWDARREAAPAPRALEPPPHDEVQRRLLPDPEGRRRRIFRRGGHAARPAP